MINYAGRYDVDYEIGNELKLAGIEIKKLPETWRENSPEMRTIIYGELAGWQFTRAWRYWIAKGPGIPSKEAELLHKKYGKEIRVDGDCGCPSPLERFHGFGVGLYHVDTQQGLNALSGILKDIYINEN